MSDDKTPPPPQRGVSMKPDPMSPPQKPLPSAPNEDKKDKKAKAGKGGGFFGSKKGDGKKRAPIDFDFCNVGGVGRVIGVHGVIVANFLWLLLSPFDFTIFVGALRPVWLLQAREDRLSRPHRISNILFTLVSTQLRENSR
jgi:hypothetical protein